MADNTINIKLEVNDGGKLAEKTQRAKELNEQLKQMSTGTQSGSRAETASAKFSNQAYTQASGVIGKTGAGARNFAAESQGLGGLVRLYATYAANLFAVSAAFKALSNAADTTNMIQGMNQLGAASGLALGNIAKDLVKATDGAISMREAIEATTKGTAAGLSAKQMEQLGQVANKASKALGIAVPDAISRLTRGISKLEPELLDELGLFTKIGPATENYARSIGKSVSALTDFERRQAFANAVLKEGIDKFSAIDIAANPYDKLLSALKDLSFKALELVNTVFVPLVNLLSQNPTALLGVLAAIGLTIVKTAIPALGQYRENLKRTADESRVAFSKMYKNQQEAYSNLAQDQAVAAERAFKNTKQTQDRIQALSQEGSKFTRSKRVDYTGLASKNPFELSETEISALDARAKYLATRNAKEASMMAAHVKNIRDIRAELSNVGDVAAAKAISSSEKIYSTALANDIINRKRLQTLSAQTIRSNVAETQATYGMRAAWKQLNEDLDAAKKGFLKVQTGVDESGKAIMQTAPKLGTLEAGYTKVAGGVGIVVQKLATTVQAFGAVGMAIGVAIGTFQMFDSLMTKTEKESEAFNKAMEGTADAVDNANRTLTALAKQPGIASGSIQGILALSNASNTTTGAIEQQLDATKALLQALNSSTWDRGKNAIAGLFGKDIASESAKNLANTVQTQLKLFRAAGLGDQATQDFKAAIGVESLDIDTVTTAFKESTVAQDAFAQSNKQLNNRLLESSTKLQSFKTATDAVTKAYDEFIQSTASTNPLFKIGAALEDLSVTMQKLASSDIKDINAAFNELVDNPKKIAQFGEGFVNQFVAIRQEFKTTLQQYYAYAQSIANIQEQIDQKTEQKKNVKSASGRRVGFVSIGPSVEEQKAAYDKDIANLEKAKGTVTDLKLGVNIEVFTKARDLFTKGITDSFATGSKLIEIALGQASQQAALTVARAGIGALTGAEAAKETGRIKQEELKLQLDQVNSTISLITSNTLLTATLAETNALMAVAQADNDKAPDIVKSEAAAALKAAQIFKVVLAQISEGRMKASQLAPIAAAQPEDVRKFLLQQILPYNRAVAQQSATAIKIRGESTATTAETARATKLGDLENINKRRNLENEINQQLISRVDILSSIDEFNSAQQVKERARLETLILENKQQQEIDTYTTAIANAKALGNQGAEEVKKQEKLLQLAEERQKREKDNKGFSDRVKLQAAELADATKLNVLKEAVLDQNIAILNTISSISGISTEQNVKEIARLENIKLDAKFALEIQKAQENINLLLEQAGPLLEEASQYETASVKRAREALALLKERQKLEKDNKALQDALKSIDVRIAAAAKLNALNEAIIDQNIAIKNTVSSISGISTEQNVNEIARLENIKLENKFALETQKIQETITALKDKGGKDSEESLALARNELSVVQQRQALERDNKGLQDALKLVEARAAIERELAGFRKATADAQSQQAEDELNFKKQNSLITEDQATKEKASIDRARQAREYQKDLNDLLEKENRKKILENQLAQYGDFGGGETYDALFNSYQALSKVIAENRAAVEANNTQKLNAIDLTESLSKRQIAYSDIFKQTFEGMADAIVEFVKTGKADFKGLIDSMLSDLLRFELRQQTLAIYQAARPGLMSLFGGGTGMGAQAGTATGAAMGYGALAKGGGFDHAIERFAMGGAFTNKIVSSPTLFKFASGAGMMGEAGPEAIMPLKRDSQGNLGVRAGNNTQQTNVVVNNYSGAPAETKETIDSRGNRKIEITVGDMVAGEMTRPGSNTQSTLRNTYGLKPALVRR